MWIWTLLLPGVGVVVDIARGVLPGVGVYIARGVLPFVVVDRATWVLPLVVVVVDIASWFCQLRLRL